MATGTSTSSQHPSAGIFLPPVTPWRPRPATESLYVAARDSAGAPLFVLDVAMPGDLHELEDAYQVS
jgi:hypothetical protein